jgi:hypothetical protein
MATILSHPLMVGTVLPFILVFTLIFAILQKTKILGDGKKQIDALVALAIALIVVSFGYATGIIISLVPVLAIGAVVLLIFMLLYGMVFEPGKFAIHDKVKWVVGILAAIAVIIATMVATGAWGYVVDLFNTGGTGSFNVTNLIFVIIVAIAVALVVMGGGGEKKKE